MKKLVALILALLIALLALLLAMAEEVPTIRQGVLPMLSKSEAEGHIYKGTHPDRAAAGIGGLCEQCDPAVSDGDAPKVKREIVCVDTLDTMLMVLNAGDIDEMDVYETVAKYFIHSNPNLVQVVTISEDAEENSFALFAHGGLMSNDFAFMLLKDNEALRDEFDAALASITEAEMDKLVQTHITAAIDGDGIPSQVVNA